MNVLKYFNSEIWFWLLWKGREGSTLCPKVLHSERHCWGQIPFLLCIDAPISCFVVSFTHRKKLLSLTFPYGHFLMSILGTARFKLMFSFTSKGWRTNAGGFWKLISHQWVAAFCFWAGWLELFVIRGLAKAFGASEVTGIQAQLNDLNLVDGRINLCSWTTSNDD